MELEMRQAAGAASACPRRAAIGAVAVIVLALSLHSTRAAESTNKLVITESVSIWTNCIGGGFRRGVRELNISGGYGYGLKAFGTTHNHNWWLTTAQFGWILSDVVGRGHWYEGNWEAVVEGFGGEQIAPDREILFGGAPLLRYDFAAGHRLVPFVDGGSGISYTTIKDGDLSTQFEFNLQAGVGLHYFIRENIAVTLQCRLIHLSNAGIEFPNLGVNNTTFLAGLTWCF